ncbi:hypothetical protein BV22DRAFT_1041722 [Leucogyrophana mollusca]|uniref:Uncharacterized protein n=1 Tax=Leucogyrophana mollusca TaxID=85980 RepID=A0ACB8AY99_9AGAM|nr:hypothetical protein BV22DRAFT_1041722 [Leucogyrophana mollusca]
MGAWVTEDGVSWPMDSPSSAVRSKLESSIESVSCLRLYIIMISTPRRPYQGHDTRRDCARCHLDVTGDIRDQVYNLRKYHLGPSIPFSMPPIINTIDHHRRRRVNRSFVLMATHEWFEGGRSPLLDNLAPFEENDEDKNMRAWLKASRITA